MFRRVRQYLIETTGLSPVRPYQPVPASAFVAAFASPPGVIPPTSALFPSQRGFGEALFQSSMDMMRRAADAPEAIAGIAKRMGVALVEFFVPGLKKGAAAISDADGRTVDAASLRMSTRAAGEAAGLVSGRGNEHERSPERHARDGREISMRWALLNDKNSQERAALYDFIQPMEPNGGVKPAARMGWKGMIQAVRGIDVRGPMAAEGGVMDMVVRGNDTLMGISLLSCGADRTQSVKAALRKALDLGLPLPDRQDGRRWNMDSPVDKEMTKALFGRPDSPFVVGSHAPLAEGAPILLNDRTLVALNRLSHALSPGALERNFAGAKQAMTRIFTRQAAEAATPSERAEATRKLNAIGSSQDFGTYNDCRAAESVRIGTERQQEAAAVQARMEEQSPDLAALMRALDATDAAPPKPAVKPVSWEAVREAFPDWTPGPQNITFTDAGPLLTLPREIAQAMKATPHVMEMEGFDATRDLAPGHYKDADGQAFGIAMDAAGQRSVVAVPEMEPEGSMDMTMARAPTPSSAPEPTFGLG